MNGKVVMISGAAGGLGQALTARFAETGWRVAAGFHTSTVASISGEFMGVPLDVRNRVSVNSAVKDVLDRWGRLDVLINNAGVTADELLVQLTEEQWLHVMQTNLKGTFNLSQAAIRTMLKKREGHIINISSNSALHGAKGQTHYAASKAGIIGLTQSLAKETGSRNVRVNAVLPGILPTRMTAGLSPELMSAFADANALGRINDIDEVARFVVFLAGMQNVSGQVFQLDSRIGRWC